MTRLSPISLRSLLIELFIVVVVGLLASRTYQTPDENLPLAGAEAQFLTGSAYIASQSLRETGHLSLWNPWIIRGEPTINDAYSFILNPLSSVPSLLFGARNGVKLSVVVYAVFAGLGGWFLGRMLNLSAPARVILAVMLIGRGGLNAVTAYGYPQFGEQQTFFPWVVGGSLAIVRCRDRRWPIVLVAAMLTLQFWAGIIYYTLPTVLMVLALAAVFTPIITKRRWENFDFDRKLLARFGAALLLTIALSAATLLPVFAYRSSIGGHNDETPERVYEHPAIVTLEFFSTDRYEYQDTWNETYFNFAAPLWFVALLFLVLPPISPALHHPPEPRTQRRVAIVALVMIFWFLTWGTGTNPIMRWLYQNVPLIGQWRVLSRMLTVTAFWIVVLVAMRFDGLWRALVISKRWNRWFERWLRFPKNTLQALLGLGLLAVGFAVTVEMIGTWSLFGGIEQVNPVTSNCVRWLHERYGEQPVSVWMRDYQTLTPFLEYKVRSTNFSGDYHLIGQSSRLYNGDLRAALPEYVLSYDQNERRDFLAKGYTVVEDGPTSDDAVPFPCLLHNSDVLSYAFTIPTDTLLSTPDMLDPDVTTPVTSLRRVYDQVGLVVSGDLLDERVLVVQELAFPGWYVTIDGARAPLEPVGQMVGVILPRDNASHRILFVYDPPLLKLGGLITLITALACALYLLEIDRLPVRLRGASLPPRVHVPLALPTARPKPVPPREPQPVVQTASPPPAEAETPHRVVVVYDPEPMPTGALVALIAAVALLVLLAAERLGIGRPKTRR